MQKFHKVNFPKEQALELSHFRDMDYYAVNNYSLPIELMMENAGLQLANLIAHFVDKTKIIQVGIGNGNNGGGGLVAARRLAAWGYEVHLHLFTDITKELPLKQLERATNFGAKTDFIDNPNVWVDAYLGFSQRLPLRDNLLSILEKANQSKALKFSLDIPTGFLGDVTLPYFKANHILTLAAPKRILYNLDNTNIYVADLGIPKVVYDKFKVEMLPFEKGNIVKLNDTSNQT